MRIRPLFPVLFVLILGIAATAFAGEDTWTPLGPDGAAQVISMAADPVQAGTLYAGGAAGAGVWKTTDAGESWFRTDAGLPASAGHVTAIAVAAANNAIVYASTANRKIFRSDDSGANWAQVFAGPPGNTLQSSIVIDPDDVTHVYVSWNAAGVGLFRTTDGGANWEQHDPVAGAAVRNVTGSGNPLVLYAALGPHGVWKSTDGASTWAAANTGLPDDSGSYGIPRVAVHPGNPDVLYLMSNIDGYVYRSDDGAANWTLVSAEWWGFWDFFVEPSTGNAFAVGYDINGPAPTHRVCFFKSTDGGIAFTNLTADHVAAELLVFDAAGRIFTTMDDGVFMSDDGGATWTPRYVGLRIYDASFAFAPSNPSILWASFYNSMGKSTDGGATFDSRRPSNSPPYGERFAIHPTNPDVVITDAYDTCYATSDTVCPDSSVMRSIDGGATWTHAPNPLAPDDHGLAQVWSLLYDPANPQIVYALAPADEPGAYKSTDGGQNFATAAGIGTILWPNALVATPTNPPRLYMATGNTYGCTPGIWRSEDRAGSWNHLTNGIPAGAVVRAIAIDPQASWRLFAAVLGEVDPGVYMSEDGGDSWGRLPGAGLPDGPSILSLAVHPEDTAVMFLGLGATSPEPRVYRSLDRGSSWQPFDAGLPSTVVWQFGFDPGNAARLLAGTRAGLYEITMTTRTLTVSLSGGGTGHVTSSGLLGPIDCPGTCVAEFPLHATIELTATADDGSYFTGWSGGGCSGTGTCVVTMDDAQNVGAAFAAAPTATVSGDTDLCTGGGATISASLTGAPPWNLIWSDTVEQNGVTASPATRIVYPAVSTTYTITSVSDTNGAGTSSGSATVNVTPGTPPVITAPASACGNSTYVASVPDAGEGATYQWTVAGGSVPGGITNRRMVAFRRSSPGSVTLTVTVTSGSGCGTSAVTIPVNALPGNLLTLGASAACPGTAGLTATGPDAGPGATYDWTVDYGTITGGIGTNAITFDMSADGPAMVRLTVTNSSGCSRTLNGTVQPWIGLALSERMFPVSGGNGYAIVSTSCGWSASSSTPWLRITSPASGSGDATVAFALDPNPISAPRSATLAIGGIEVPIHQRGTDVKDGNSLVVYTLAGHPYPNGYANGPVASANFDLAMDVIYDGAGNAYVADNRGQMIRKLDTSGEVSTFAGVQGIAGYRDGSATDARFFNPTFFAFDSAGNLYVTEAEGLPPITNNTIRKITPSGEVTTFAGRPGVAGSDDGPAASATFNLPHGIAFDAAGNLYVADAGNRTIRKIDTAGNVSTIAGSPGVIGSTDGIGTAASFNFPNGLAFDPVSGDLFLVDSGANKIRRVTTAGTVTTFAGSGSGAFADGAGTAASFWNPWGIVADGGGGFYVTDRTNRRIRRIDGSANVTTLAGSSAFGPLDGVADAARFYGPYGVTIDPDGNLLVVDFNRLRRVTTGDGTVTTISGLPLDDPFAPRDGNGADAYLGQGPLARHPDGSMILAEGTYLRRITPEGDVTTIAGGMTGFADGPVGEAQFGNIAAVAVANDGTIYIGDQNYRTIRKIQNGVVTTIAGIPGAQGTVDGPAAEALFNAISSIGVDTPAGLIYVADGTAVRQVDSDGTVRTIAGHPTIPGFADGVGSAARFGFTAGLTVGINGDVYVSDANFMNMGFSSNLIRKIRVSDWNVSTIAGKPWRFGAADGNGDGARFAAPLGLNRDDNDNLWIPDARTGTIRKVTPSGDVTTLAGFAEDAATIDGIGSASRFTFWPRSVVVDGGGRLFVSDMSVIRTAVMGVTPTATLSGDTNACAGGVATLTVDLTGVPPWSITWSDGVTESGIESTPWTREVTAPSTTTWTLTAFSDSESPGVFSGSATVTMPDLPPAEITAPASLCGNVQAVASVPDAGLDATYQWTITGGAIVAGANSRVVAFRGYNSTGILTLSVTIGTPDGCRADHVSIPYTPRGPGSIQLSQASACPGSTGLTASIPDLGEGAQYQWSVDYGTITSGQGTNQITFDLGYEGSARVILDFVMPAGCPRTLSTQVQTAAAVAISERMFGAAGGSGHILLTTGCGWTFASNAPWLTPASPPDGAGDATLAFTVAPNPFSNPRSATLTVAGIEIPISQEGLDVRDGFALETAVLAGHTGSMGPEDGPGAEARFMAANDVVVDSAGNAFVADFNAHTIRKIDPAGNVTTFAGLAGHPGYRDGTGTSARFTFPTYLAIDAAGNLYVTEGTSGLRVENHTIRRITPAGVVTTFAGRPGVAGSDDGPLASATFNAPSDLVFDGSGNLYVVDTNNFTIRKISTTGFVSTLAGTAGNYDLVDGVGPEAAFGEMYGIAWDSVSGDLFVADLDYAAIRRVTLGGAVSWFAGGENWGWRDGSAEEAMFYYPLDLESDGAGNLYVADYQNWRLRKVTQTGDVTTIAGSGVQGILDGFGSDAQFAALYGLGVHPGGDIFVADSGRIRRVSPAGDVVTIAGRPPFDPSLPRDGTGTDAFLGTGQMAFDLDGSILLPEGATLRRITPEGVVTTVAGSASGTDDGPIETATFRGLSGVAVDPSGAIFLADVTARTIRKIEGGTVSTVAGIPGATGYLDGPGSEALFSAPRSIVLDASGNLFVADNAAVRRIGPDGTVSTFAGSMTAIGTTDGPGTDARFTSIYALAMDPDGNLIAGDGTTFLGTAHTIRRIAPDGTVTTIAGKPWRDGASDGPASEARFVSTGRGAFDEEGNYWFTDFRNVSIRRMDSGGNVTTLAGFTENYGTVDGIGSAARFAGNMPSLLAAPDGRLYVSEGGRIRIAAMTVPGPLVTSVDPASGPISGGTSITINGGAFQENATVTFGGAAASNVVVQSDTSITATTPAHVAGLVDVVVTNPDALSGQLRNGFTYLAPPTVGEVTPATGTTAGGTSVSITGTAFRNGLTVSFGGANATDVVVVSGTLVTAKTPPHVEGTVTVVVTNDDGQQGEKANAFRFAAPPAPSSIAPASGSTAGGTNVTIEGTGFQSGVTVTFGGVAATNVAAFGATLITAVTPAHVAGTVPVVVANPDGQTAEVPGGFTYAAPPVVSFVAPSAGPAAGGTGVTISGSGFEPGAIVAFGGAPATDVVVTGPGSITATTPPHAAGGVTVTVTNPDGQSGQRANGFTYVAASDSVLVAGTGSVCDGGTVTIPIVYSGSAAPFAIQFEATFDPAKLSVVSVDTGALTAGFDISVNSSAGRVVVAMASPAATGTNGEIARITFQGLAGLGAGGSAEIAIGNALVNDDAATGAPGLASCPACRRGDVNANGQITAFDASLVLQITVGTLVPDAAQECAADFNQNGTVTAYDAALILQCVVGTGPCS